MSAKTYVGTSSLKLSLSQSAIIVCTIHNVYPCVERRTPSRDESTVWASQVSPSQIYEIFISISLFFSYFCSRKLIYNEKIIVGDYAIDRFVDTVDRRSSIPPLLNCDHQSFLEFRST